VPEERVAEIEAGFGIMWDARTFPHYFDCCAALGLSPFTGGNEVMCRYRAGCECVAAERAARVAR